MYVIKDELDLLKTNFMIFLPKKSDPDHTLPQGSESTGSGTTTLILMQFPLRKSFLVAYNVSDPDP